MAMAVTLTDLLARETPSRLGKALALGWNQKVDLRASRRVRDTVQAVYGIRSGRLLSDPESQHKLGMGVVPSYGLTLHHHLMRSKIHPVTIDACPSAGDCRQVCVLNNNFGRFRTVQDGWRWRTELAAWHPVHFFALLGSELRRALGDRPHILFRPNINSDVRWEQVCPALVDGSVFGDAVTLYGYTKHADYLAGDPWVTPHYHVAYSWNESADAARVQQYLDRGGNVAVVTDRLAGGFARKRPVRQWADGTCLGLTAPVVDADTGDEWMLNNTGVIGDLGFKPRTAALRQFGRTSDFVAKVYDLQQRLPI